MPLFPPTCSILLHLVLHHLYIQLHRFCLCLSDLSKSYHCRPISSTVFVSFFAFLCFFLKPFYFYD
nr:MAG TPA: hypothetical protein [Caudoviricetes sp.]